MKRTLLFAHHRVASSARRVLVPSTWATIRWRQEGARIHDQSQRRLGLRARFAATYAPTGDVDRSELGSLEHFLTERDCLNASNARGYLFCGHVVGNDQFGDHVHHEPWPLETAEASFGTNSLMQWLGLGPLDEAPPLLHDADRMDVGGVTLRGLA